MLYNESAIMIQKIWRGFNTRKLLREYFDELYLKSKNLIPMNLPRLNKS